MEKRLTVPPESKNTKSNAIEIPQISVPSGGGAIRGIDEKLDVNTVNGTSTLAIPVPAQSSRGFAPSLAVTYDSGYGNGVFGMGWSLNLPSIARDTARHLPLYDDGGESDDFLLSGSEDLVPKFRTDGSGRFVSDGTGGYAFDEWRQADGTRVRRYVPRTEGAFARIERHLLTDGSIRWKVTDRSNVVTLFGWSARSRLSSSDGRRVFQWLPEFSFDNKGNCMEYFYDHESADDIDLSHVYDKNRIGRDGAPLFSGIYLVEIRYGNRTPFFAGDERPARETYRFRTEFEYLRHRSDAFSDYRAGFERRISRLCCQIRSVNRFDALPGGEAVVSSLDFEYGDGDGFSCLQSVRSTGYIRHADLSYTKKSLPATTFSYRQHRWDRTLHDLSLETGDAYSFTDLDGEGLPGLLYEKEGNWYYRRNLGHGNFGKPLAIMEKPSFSGPFMYLTDLNGDGCKQLVNLSIEPKGFFEKSASGKGWERMTCFKNLPNRDTGAKGSRMIDLDGDGRADILVCEDDVFTWYESKGRDGYAKGTTVPFPLDEDHGPTVSFADEEQAIFLADMSGDGLIDIVRVRQGEVCYWPNMGYGHFGSKITLENSPVFASPDRFDPSKVHLVDIDASGPCDLVYLGNGRFECWMNRCGSAFDREPFVIDGIPEVASVRVDFADILGTGIPCMVWIPDPISGKQGHVKYIDLAASMKPHVMSGYVTGAGKRVSFDYTSSIQFYLEDYLGGHPWPERLPMPVHCLTCIETEDLVTGHRFVRRFTYHNGHYDHTEKEFRGFALIEQTDSENFERWKKESTNYLREDLHQMPVVTRMWFRTGSLEEKIDIEACPGLESLDTGLWKEAHRAARASNERTTVSSEDGMPYSDSEHHVSVRMLQPKGQNRYGVFMPLSKETIERTYEDGDVDDSHMTQTMNLSFDAWGHPVERAVIAYARKKMNPSLPEEIRRMQQESVISYEVNRYTGDILSEDTHLLRLPYRQDRYVLEGLEPSGGVFKSVDFASWQRYATLISANVTRYYSDDLLTAAPVGNLAFPAISFDNHVLAYTDDLLREAFEGRVTDSRMEDLRYEKLDGENGWWIPSGRAILLDEGETAEAAKERFYVPILYRNPFGASTQVRFNDRDMLLIAGIVDPFGNENHVREYDYRTLLPSLTEDVNGNFTSVAYDHLGFVYATALMGKGDETDDLDGFTDRTEEEDEAMVEEFFRTSSYGDLSALAGKLLRNATSRLVYRLDRYEKEGKPLCAARIVREEHAHGCPDSPLQISFDYSSGLGGVILSKVQAEIPGDDSAVRWLGNGRTILNNKGNAVMQYEPYFSGTPAFDDAVEMVEQGVTPILHYDPLGRLTRTDYPDGTFSKTEFSSWERIQYDQIDTVQESDWYRTREAPAADRWEKSAAEKSAALADTPEREYLDALSRVICLEQADGVLTRFYFDKYGHLEKVVDARGNTVVRYTYDLLGNITSMHGMDEGSRWILLDIIGNPGVSLDQRGHRQDYFYDIVGRPVRTVVRDGDGDRPLDNVVSRNIYAEELAGAGQDKQTLRAKNLMGNIVLAYDTAGCTRINGRDYAGRVLSSAYHLASNYMGTVDWKETDPAFGLEQEEFVTSVRYDAMGRLVQRFKPDRSEECFRFGRGGLPQSVYFRKRDEQEQASLIKSVTYNEKRQCERVVFGNDVSTRYTYDPETFLIRRIFTVKKNGEVLQDLNYTYDAAGHVTHLVDKAVPVEFCGNHRVEGDSDYTYDPFYRLIAATGRENGAAVSAPDPLFAGNGSCGLTLKSGDPVSLRTYTEKYSYDSVGNLLQMRHIASSNNWTRDYEYAEDSNRLLATRIGDRRSTYPCHSRHGFMTSMDHLSVMAWNFRDELAITSRQAVGADRESGQERTYYQYSSEGRRVRKITVSGKYPDGTDIIKDERIYLDCDMEIYRRHSGLYKGLERISQTVFNGGGICLATIETRNDIDDGTVRTLVRYQFGNNVGSSSLELNDQAKIIGYEEFHPYGTTAYFATNHEIKAAAKRFRFTGMERDDETCLQYHAARYYIPWLGRWTSPDPIGVEGGLNLYCYCAGDPVGKEDRRGTLPDAWVNNPTGVPVEDYAEEKKGMLKGQIVGTTIIISTGAVILSGGTALGAFAAVGEGAVTTQQVGAIALASYSLISSVDDLQASIRQTDSFISQGLQYAITATTGAEGNEVRYASYGIKAVFDIAAGRGANVLIMEGKALQEGNAAARAQAELVQDANLAKNNVAEQLATLNQSAPDRLMNAGLKASKQAAAEGNSTSQAVDRALIRENSLINQERKTLETELRTMESRERLTQNSLWLSSEEGKTMYAGNVKYERFTTHRQNSMLIYTTSAGKAAGQAAIAGKPNTSNSDIVMSTISIGHTAASDYLCQ